MSEFKYTIAHVPGSDNKVSDALSRNPVDAPQSDVMRDDDFKPPLMVSVVEVAHEAKGAPLDVPIVAKI